MKTINGLQFNEYMDFPKEGVNFVDFTPSICDKEVFDKAIEKIASLVNENIDYIIAPGSRGYIWGMGYSMYSKIPMVPVLKKGKLPLEATQGVVTYDTEYSTDGLILPKCVDLKDKKCLFIDDVYATGGTYKACKKMIEEVGGTMIGGVVVLDIEIEQNNEIQALLKSSEL